MIMGTEQQQQSITTGTGKQQQSIDSSITTKDSNIVNQKDEQQQPDEELNVMLMLIDKAKELEQQKYKDKQQPTIKKEIVKELDEMEILVLMPMLLMVMVMNPKIRSIRYSTMKLLQYY